MLRSMRSIAHHDLPLHKGSDTTPQPASQHPRDQQLPQQAADKARRRTDGARLPLEALHVAQALAHVTQIRLQPGDGLLHDPVPRLLLRADLVLHVHLRFELLHAVGQPVHLLDEPRERARHVEPHLHNRLQDVRIGRPADRHRRPVTRSVCHTLASPPSSSGSSTLITTVPLPARQKRVGSAGSTITAPGASACTVSIPTPPSSGTVCTCPLTRTSTLSSGGLATARTVTCADSPLPAQIVVRSALRAKRSEYSASVPSHTSTVCPPMGSQSSRSPTPTIVPSALRRM